MTKAQQIRDKYLGIYKKGQKPTLTEIAREFDVYYASAWGALIGRPVIHNRRGFANMDPQLQRAIAAAGGRASWKSGKAHRLTPETARAANLLSQEAKKKKRELIGSLKKLQILLSK